MSYAVVITEAAERDLSGIFSYLADDLNAPSAVWNLMQDLEELLGTLEEIPYAYPRVHDELLAAVGYRWHPLASYLAFFTIDEGTATVAIERVLHGRRNWQSVLE